MNKNSFLKTIFLSLTIVILASCDSDFNELGTDIVGSDSFEFGTPIDYSVLANTLDYGVVESTGLAVNPLGIYNNPTFGITKANVAIQVLLANENPTIDLSLFSSIDSVMLTIPYFIDATKTVTNSDQTKTYTLDSIYDSSTNNKIKLSVYENKFFIKNDIDPVTGESYPYYTNQNEDFNAVKGDLLNQTTDDFIFSPAEYSDEVTEVGSTTTTKKFPPAMRLSLEKEFFKTKIFSAASNGKLLNNNIFSEYFRGLYFKVENSGDNPGSLAMINFKGGSITIKYKELEKAPTAIEPMPKIIDKTITLNLSGKSVSLLENTPIVTQNLERLYLKGGEGSMAEIKLFNNDELTQLRADSKANKLLVNDASLTFYVDEVAMNGSQHEPQRIYLYDINNKRPIADYYSDQSSSSKPKFAKKNLGGTIVKDAVTKKGIRYKIRLTNHIRNLISSDTVTNVKLGLVVTESITTIDNKYLKSSTLLDKKIIPTASVMNPLGTILYGSNIPVTDKDYNKRLQLKIYYTKPKQD